MLTDAIQIVQGNITQIAVDVVVNAANTSLLGGGGVDGAIHRAGGKTILEACRKIVARQGSCKTGEAVITTAGLLPARYVIHTVGPVWNGGQNRELEKLASCYTNSLLLALENGCHTIAFPAISTGVYRFPKAIAANIAYTTVYRFIQLHPAIRQVLFVCFDKENFQCLQSAQQYLGNQPGAK